MSSKKTAQAAAKGRPKGAKTQDLDIQERLLPACKDCGSTNRRVIHTQKLDHGGTHQGRSYSRIIWRRCKCSDCGKVRVEKSFET